MRKKRSLKPAEDRRDLANHFRIRVIPKHLRTRKAVRKRVHDESAALDAAARQEVGSIPQEEDVEGLLPQELSFQENGNLEAPVHGHENGVLQIRMERSSSAPCPEHIAQRETRKTRYRGQRVP